MRKSNPQFNNGNKRRREKMCDARDKFRKIKKIEDSTPKKFGPKFTEYARMNAMRRQILMDIESDEYFHWPRPINPDIENRNQNLYCIYNKDVGRNTEDCCQLKDEI